MVKAQESSEKTTNFTDRSIGSSSYWLRVLGAIGCFLLGECQQKREIAVQPNVEVASNEVDQPFAKLPGKNVKVTNIQYWNSRLWVGTTSGLWCVGLEQQRRSIEKITENEVTCIEPYQDRLLVGTTRGIYAIDLDQNFAVERVETFMERTLDPRPVKSAAFCTSIIGPLGPLGGTHLLSVATMVATPASLTNSVEIRCLKTGPDGRLFIGTNRDLYQGSGYPLSLLRSTFRHESISISSICIDSGNVWIGTSSGVFLIDDDRISGVGQSDRIVKAIVANGRKLYISRSRILQLRDLNTGKETDFESEGGVTSFAVHGDEIWAASNRGLYVKCANSVSFANSKIAAGEIADVCFSQEGDLWAATVNGLLYFIARDGDGAWTPTIRASGPLVFPHIEGDFCLWRICISDYQNRSSRGLLRLEIVDGDGAPVEHAPIEAIGDSLQVAIRPKGSGLKRISARLIDVHGRVATRELGGLYYLPWWLVLATVSIGLTITLISLSVRIQRWVRVYVLGERWRFTIKKCDHEVVVNYLPGDKQVRLAVGHDGEGFPVTLDGKWPPEGARMGEVRARLGKPSARVRVEVVEPLFCNPWAQLIGGPLSCGDASIAGQICLLNELLTIRRPEPKHIVFAGLGCDTVSYEPALPPLNFTDDLEWGSLRYRVFRRLGRIACPSGEIDLVVERFQLWGASILSFPTDVRHNATADTLIHALTSADIVHVSAHASPEGVFLHDGFVGEEALRAVLDKVRCRLLVLSACDAGHIPTRNSFVFPLVRCGVSVLAATKQLPCRAARDFFSAFYTALLPGRRATGVEIATALRRGANYCLPAGSGIRRRLREPGIDSLIFYGDPTLQIRLEREN